LVLAPCFWHSRIHAGDLSSHAYNAWLAGQVEQRPVPGLTVVPQYSNVLFDLMLSSAMRTCNAGNAQRIVVAACVLIFFWGSFAFVSAMAGGFAWWIAPCLAMLSYGYVFHMGFFNYYLSLGLCLFAVAAWLTGRTTLRAIGLVLLAIAWTAHSLPVVWAIGVLIAMRLAERFPRAFFPAGAAALVAMHFVITTHYRNSWGWDQRGLISGTDQFALFGPAYRTVATCALVLAFPIVWLRSRRFGAATLIGSPESQVLGLLALAVLVIPSGIALGDYQVPLEFLPQRLSLTVALVACVVMAGGPVARWQAAGCWILMAAYGIVLYDAVTAKVSALKPGQRVIVASAMPVWRVDLLTHIVDRACIGHCFSYANYEPCTLAFRLRATGKNDLVTADCDVSLAIKGGTYIVKADDPAFVQVNICPGDRVVLTRIDPGQLAGHPRCTTE